MIWREARERVGVAAITGEMARIAAAVPPNVPIRLTNSAWHSARYGSWNRDSDLRWDLRFDRYQASVDFPAHGPWLLDCTPAP